MDDTQFKNFLFIKLVFLFSVFFLFFISYIFKSFQLLSLSITSLILMGFFFKKIKKDFLLLLLSISFALTFIEIFLFITNHKVDFTFKKNSDISKNVKYEKTFLGYQPKPGTHYHVITSNGKTLLNSTYTIGKDGFRVTPRENNIDYIKNINIFGGSNAFGWGLNDNETLPFFLQKNLQNWNVKNYAINGYGVHQMLAQIENDTKILKDINILITSNFHASRSSCKKDYSFGTPKYIIDDNHNLKRSGYCGNLLLTKYQLPKIFGSIINRSEIKKLLDKVFVKPNEINSLDIDIYISIIKRIRELIDEKNQEFFVGYIENSLNDLDKIIFQEFKKENIEYINLSLEPKKDYELYDGHPNKEANIKRSLMILEYIKNSKNK